MSWPARITHPGTCFVLRGKHAKPYFLVFSSLRRPAAGLSQQRNIRVQSRPAAKQVILLTCELSTRTQLGKHNQIFRMRLENGRLERNRHLPGQILLSTENLVPIELCAFQNGIEMMFQFTLPIGLKTKQNPRLKQALPLIAPHREG